jgi:hypothetical protein
MLAPYKQEVARSSRAPPVSGMDDVLLDERGSTEPVGPSLDRL